MRELTGNAFAKINLTLDVTGRRDDGYHLVRMVMQSVSLHDTLSLQKNLSGKDDLVILDERQSVIAKKEAPLLPDNDNLILRAVRAVKEAYGIKDGVTVTLTKRIPMAAGLAGGSADAAAAFAGMNRLFDLGASAEELQALALPLGADIPFCLTGGTCLAEGIGEKLTPLSLLPPCTIVLAKPLAAVSTKAVYEALDVFEKNGSYPDIEHPDVAAQMAALSAGDLQGVCLAAGNVLEPVTRKTEPSVGKLCDALQTAGALCAMMSGSGPTVFGIFEGEAQVEQAFLSLQRQEACAELHQVTISETGVLL